MIYQHDIVTFQKFDWTSPDETVQISWPITRMLYDIGNGKLKFQAVVAEIDKDFVENWLVKREPDMEYVRSLPDAQLIVPVLGAWMPRKSVVLIDGTHRYMARYLQKRKTIPYILLAVEDWLPYATITGDLSTC